MVEAEVKSPEAVKAAHKRDKRIDPQRMGAAESMRQDWVCNAEAGTEVADILDPGYWSHMASQMVMYARIDVRIDTGEWLLELLVLEVGRNWARVALLNKHDLQVMDDADVVPEQYAAKWRGPQLKWSVVRLVDQHVLQENMASKEEATSWIVRYEKTIRTT